MTTETKKAVLLVTVYRRYHELQKNLERTKERALDELGYMPDVVLVWAAPEVSRLWLMQELMAKGLITHLVKRYQIDGLDGDRPTTFSESRNIRLGLDFILQQYGPSSYCVMHAADIWLQGGTLKFIDDRINGRVEEGEHQAVLFHWANPIIHSDIWATYMFGVRLDDKSYWPPVSPDNEQDVLERQWGRKLMGKPGVFRWHNARDQKFLHRHESEDLPDFPRKSQFGESSLPCSCRGHLPWYKRIVYEIKKAYHFTVHWLAQPVFRQEKDGESYE